MKNVAFPNRPRPNGWQTERLLNIGHRGARGHVAENTLASIDCAINLGVDAIEIDVQLCAGELVVIHDRRVERTTNGYGCLQETAFTELRRLDAGAGNQVPTLKEVLALCRHRTAINIELKGPDSADAVARILRAEIARYQWFQGRLLLSSFDHRQLARLSTIFPDVPRGVLLGGVPLNLAETATHLGARSVNIDIAFADAALIEDAKRRNMWVYVYTVNEPDDLAWMLELGVDGVFSDFPDRVRDMFAERQTLRAA